MRQAWVRSPTGVLSAPDTSTEAYLATFGTRAQAWDRQYPWAAGRQAEIYDFVGAEAVRQQALDLMRAGIEAAEAEPAADPELVFEHAFVEPPPNLREGWRG